MNKKQKIDGITNTHTLISTSFDSNKRKRVMLLTSNVFIIIKDKTKRKQQQIHLPPSANKTLKKQQTN